MIPISRIRSFTDIIMMFKIETALLTGLGSQNRAVVLMVKNRNLMIWQTLQQMQEAGDQDLSSYSDLQ